MATARAQVNVPAVPVSHADESEGASPPVGRARRPARVSVGRVLVDSFRLFGLRAVLRRPVMFAVWVLFLFLLVVTVFPRAFPDLNVPGLAAYNLGLDAILFLTVWFSNISEAIAEAQGRAQAQSLRSIKGGLRARKLLADGSIIWVPAEALAVGDRVEVRAGEPIPVDGDVVRGAAMIDESMMTGESAPVTRESGGDKTSVLGGTRVVQGTVVIRGTAVQGQSFLDRLIRLVEGTSREATPNELALSVLLASLTIALLVVIVTFVYQAAGAGFVVVALGTMIALFVALAPTTIAALLPAIGISGVNRVAAANIIAKSGKAVEAAGDLDVLILDKTGTITVGNRLATQFVPAPDVAGPELLRYSMLASSLDDTPEGRSIVRLAALRGAVPDRLAEGSFRVLPFTPERKMSGVVLADGTEVYKGSIEAMAAYGAVLPTPLVSEAQEASRQGMTPLVISRNRVVLGLVVLKDVIKPGIRDRVRELKLMGIHTVMCTGDNRLTAAAVAKEAGVDEFVAEAKPETKLLLVRREKAQGRLVAMSGDGANDAPALARADVGLAMNSGTSAAKEAGNMVDLDNDPTKLIEIVSIGKQLLITRGALTTFSITNDVAKYFAIVPAIFAGLNIAGVQLLNVLGLNDPALAVLSTLFFNAIIIPILIPLALRGVPFHPRPAIELLARNLAIYGLGGLVSAFVGIKLIYLFFEWVAVQPFWVALVHAITNFFAHVGGIL